MKQKIATRLTDVIMPIKMASWRVWISILEYGGGERWWITLLAFAGG